MKRVLYPNDDGGVAVLIPSPNCDLSLDEIITKDVPKGKPYLVVDVDDIPTDREFRDAWVADFTGAEVNV